MRRVYGFLLVIWLAGCGGAGGETAVATPPPTPSSREQELSAAQANWQAQQIQSYLIDIQYNEPAKDPQTLVVEVRDGTATFLDHDCMPQRTCALSKLDPATFTIDALIARAQTLLIEGEITHLVYHDTYHYPRVIESAKGTWLISNFRLPSE